ncbi:MAG: GAF domain-containing protein [Bacteroidetes bacterium]|nr:GAF domain-containing protein [Bacteroidota bacterium]
MNEMRLLSNKIAKVVASRTNSNGCSIFLLKNPDRLVLSGSTAEHLFNKDSNEHFSNMAPDIFFDYKTTESLTGWVCKHALPLNLDINDEKAVSKIYKRRGHICELPESDRNRIRGWVGIPIILGDRLYGVLRIIRTGELYSGTELELLDKMAQEFAGTIHNFDDICHIPLKDELVYRVDPGSYQILSRINIKLLDYLSNNPEAMRKMSPRKFEELIAFLLERDGWQTLVTASSRDGGYDIRAIRRIDRMDICLLVEAKRFRENNPVGVTYIRELYSVKQRQKATKAILATTSYVSPDAKKEFVDVIPWELQLLEYDDLICWIVDSIKQKS